MIAVALGLILSVAAGAPAETATPAGRCVAAMGKAGRRCLARYTKTIERCRRKADPECEPAARAEGGRLARIQGAIEAPVGRRCDDTVAFALTDADAADVVYRLEQACADWGEDAVALAYGEATAATSKCHRAVALQLRRLRTRTIALVGPKCSVRQARGKPCDRARRDGRLDALSERARARIERKCGPDFEALGLGTLDAVVEAVSTHARHFAIMVHPPNDVGPTGEPGPFPVGVRTEHFVDPARPNAAGDAPRPVVTEIYYPSTFAATEDVPRDVIRILGQPVAETPTYRDVARADGRFPLVVFSHGNNGIRVQSLAFMTHLASHGYVVASPDHHGNTFLDTVPDSDVLRNRPLDMQFVIDQLLRLAADPANALAGAIDPDRIGAFGHSFGGLAVFALVGAGAIPGVEPDPRVKAIVPHAPAAPFDDAFFATIHVPTLIIGGSLDAITPFERDQRPAFEAMSENGAFVALVELVNAGHFTFSDFCEVDRALLGFLGGFSEACEPRHLPWRYARDRVNYLDLNFFDAMLRGDAAALERLDETVVRAFDDVRYERR